MAHPLTMHLQPFFLWLLHTSWQAAILVCLILLIQKVLGRWIGVRGRYWLWLVLVIRMAMFWTPPSAVSVYNLLPTPWAEGYKVAATPKAGKVGPALAATDGSYATGGYGKAGPAAYDPQEPSAATGLMSQAKHWLTRWDTLLFLFWLAGACILTGHIVANHIRLRRLVRHEPLVTDRQILDLLEDCRSQLRIRRAVAVVATDQIGSPALLGCLRPRLLLPHDTIAKLSHQQLRHVFLHELAHLRRDDIVMGYLATLLQVLHWFNPLVALAFKRMRADREMVCDALALSVLPPEETRAYGHTIIHQIERLQASRPQWMLAALSGDKARIKQRIAMIAQFRKETFRWSPLAVLILALLACTGLTDGHADSYTPSGPGESAAVTWDAYARSDLPTTHQDKHANIQRAWIRSRLTGAYLVVEGEKVVCNAAEPSEAGLWEYRFDVVSNRPETAVYLYSVAARKYLTSDKQGDLAVNANEPDERARWGVWPDSPGVWVMSRFFDGGFLHLNEAGHVKAEFWNRDAASYWDIQRVWRVKTSDDPASNPQWQREHIRGPD
ncbi:MAG: M56 family metallopeptidase [Sedimentisphaerales bacterium]|nr:M56 family metallopeptidase [Sedimentisphaerales bacterium]